MNYMDIGHKKNLADVELWWVLPKQTGHKVQRVCPLIRHTEEDGATHDSFTDGAWRRDDKYVQGRVEHHRKVVSMVSPPWQNNLFFLRTVERLLEKEFPGYTIHQF